MCFHFQCFFTFIWSSCWFGRGFPSLLCLFLLAALSANLWTWSRIEGSLLFGLGGCVSCEGGLKALGGRGVWFLAYESCSVEAEVGASLKESKWSGVDPEPSRHSLKFPCCKGQHQILHLHWINAVTNRCWRAPSLVVSSCYTHIDCCYHPELTDKETPWVSDWNLFLSLYICRLNKRYDDARGGVGEKCQCEDTTVITKESPSYNCSFCDTAFKAAGKINILYLFISSF